ncbi:MAG: phage head closure protein [Eubacteriaceae bacterium]
MNITEDIKDADGFHEQKWTSITDNPIWADVTDLASRDYYASNAEKKEQTIRCNIAYRDDVDQSMRLNWKGKVYKIERIYQGDYRKSFLEIDAKLIEGTED